MFRLFYRLTYIVSQPRWDTGKTPPEVIEAFAHNKIVPGPVIDLGCGTGTNVIYMAQQGREAIGIDFVPEAVGKARLKAEKAGVSDRTHFLVADVTRLNRLNLPSCSFALDMGCFHGLTREGQRRYVEGLYDQMIPGGQYMLYVLPPRKEAGIAFGASPESVQEIFSPKFEITRVEQSDFWNRDALWIWMKRGVLPTECVDKSRREQESNNR
ncbi:MAG TPA: class I SAM-dependent methyltransferase [Aggregatilineaceae bacterium]|nr:class I SAM-dependent methyltransferase [Aggregatilineaceae bacterium]